MVNKNNSKKTLRSNDEPALTIYPKEFLKQTKAKSKNENLNKISKINSENSDKNQSNNKSSTLTKMHSIKTAQIVNAQNQKPKIEAISKPISEDQKVYKDKVFFFFSNS